MKLATTKDNGEADAVVGDGQTGPSGFRGLSKREFLTGLAVLGANALIPGRVSVAQAVARDRHEHDVLPARAQE